MNPTEFIAKWRRVALTERSAAQQHFLDLCDLVEHPKPAAMDPSGDSFTFERGVTKTGGGEGWADVWKRGYFGWEYKGKHKDLDVAYTQLLRYREDLENPPLLVVCDMDRIEIHTNFTNTRTAVFRIALTDLVDPLKLATLRHVFWSPNQLRPETTTEAITEEAASRIAETAQALRSRGLDPQEVARFLDRIVFCLFAEDVGLLPSGLFSRLIRNSERNTERFSRFTGELFAAMAKGGYWGPESIRHFNGNLFASSPVLPLLPEEIQLLGEASALDWSAVDASIFGTLFERGLDPNKRAQLGAHYTSRADIATVVDPVVLEPLRQKWAHTRQLVHNLLASGTETPREGSAPPGPLTGRAWEKAFRSAELRVRHFLEDLAHIKVLDPACGSGNFLYVTLQKLKDLEKEAIVFAMDQGMTAFIPQVGPWQLYGIELNRYAFELAQMTVWIGYLQWGRNNGFAERSDPILREMSGFECKDAILDLSDSAGPREASWPEVDFIVGNPPFLGNRLVAGTLGPAYARQLYSVFEDRLAGRPDLCCYWFEKARAAVAEGKASRAGLLATQGIRGGTNRKVLERIKQSGDIFFAWADRNWILDGATVHISIVGFDNGSDQQRTLNGSPVSEIFTNLTAGSDATQARPLRKNVGRAFQGAIKRGSFDLPSDRALEMLLSGGNPNRRPNSDVLYPYLNAAALTRGVLDSWIIDFGTECSLEKAAGYEAPFAWIKDVVRAERAGAQQAEAAANYWLHWRSRPELRAAIAGLKRFLCTPRVAKHRLFVWMEDPVYPDNAVVVVAVDDDYSLGLLESRAHRIWSLAQGTQLRERESGFRYTPTTCFETFPFPDPSPVQTQAIAAAAAELDRLRCEWLHPSGWVREVPLEFPGAVDGPWARYVREPNREGIGAVSYPRRLPADESAAQSLANRTLTKLYNARPAWLEFAHGAVDEAVMAAYGWQADLSDSQLLANLLEANRELNRLDGVGPLAPRTQSVGPDE